MRNAAADVPDLVQEVFLRLLRLDDHEAIRNSQAYLYTVASHVLHQHALRQTASGETAHLRDITGDLEPAAADPAIQLEVEQQFEQIGRRLRQEAPRAYATVILHRCHAPGAPVQWSFPRRFVAGALRGRPVGARAGTPLPRLGLCA